MDIEGAVTWSDWVFLALIALAVVVAFWMGREYQKGKERDEW